MKKSENGVGIFNFDASVNILAKRAPPPVGEEINSTSKNKEEIQLKKDNDNQSTFL